MSILKQCYECCNDDGEDYASDFFKPDPVAYKGQQYARIKQQCLSTGKLYTDPDFPANNSVLSLRLQYQKVVWLRPKEISSKAIFIQDGAKYYDIDQGDLGDCWFIAAVGCLFASPYKDLLTTVVPRDQGFGTDYCGAFHFCFWKNGAWEEVIIDDRLPTKNKSLIYASNREVPYEYWCPLVEKAFAKLKGSYQELHGGTLEDALKCLTGGTPQAEYLKTISHEKLIQHLSSFNMTSIMAASIIPDPRQPEAILPTGLVAGHAYSIVDIKQIRNRFGDTTLLHIRNPWGKQEWKGPWSDLSQEWNSLSDEDKKSTFKHSNDGEFWISVTDFKQNFDYLVLCHIPQNRLTASISNHTPWNSSEHHGTWVQGSSAGGPPTNFISEKFWLNPQFHFHIATTAGPVPVVISVSVIEPSDNKRSSSISISFAVIKVERGHRPKRITTDNQHEFPNKLTETSGSLWPYRTRTQRYNLDQGDYVVIPCTSMTGQGAQFELCVLSEGDVQCWPMEMVELADYPSMEMSSYKSTPEAVIDKTFNARFNKKGTIDTDDLMDIFRAAMRAAGEEPSCLSSSDCYCLLELCNMKSHRGLVDKTHVKELWSDLETWRRAYRYVDDDRDNLIDAQKLKTLFEILDFHAGPEMIEAIIKRYGGRTQGISEEDFVHIFSKALFEYYSYADLRRSQKINMTLNEWLAITQTI